MSEAQEKSSGKGCLIAIIIVLLLGIVCVGGYFYVTRVVAKKAESEALGQSPSKSPLTRNAVMSDMVLQSSSDLTLGYKFEFTPSVDIKGLSFTVEFYDKNDQLVTTKTKSIGDVVKGGQYSFTFSVTEFKLSDLFKISLCRTKIASGTVSYFA